MSETYLIYVFVFICGFMAVNVIVSFSLQFVGNIRLTKDRLNRLNRLEAHDSPQSLVIKKIRRSRRVHSNRLWVKPRIYLSHLITHSGRSMPLYSVVLMIMMMSIIGAGAMYVWKGHWVWASIGGLLGAYSPIHVLKFLVKRRVNKACVQLPETLDVIVRSLSAGHPVPVAMSLVGSEMSDPIGKEFRIANDEFVYGAKLSEVVQRLADRVGHADFDLFAANIRLQERTGGNLAELLRANAKTIRDRQKMRLKIKAASAEGRMSAMILNLAPILLYILVNLIAPDFYGEVKDSSIVKYGMIGVVIWMIIGNLVMRKMINFKI